MFFNTHSFLAIKSAQASMFDELSCCQNVCLLVCTVKAFLEKSVT